MGLHHCNLSSNDLEIVFKRLSREKLDLQNNDKYDPKMTPYCSPNHEVHQTHGSFFRPRRRRK
jgi:hypothetical protein